MSDDYKDREFLTTTQAARLLCVSPDTVLKWVKAGKVKSHRTLGGHFRIPITELELPSADAQPEPGLASSAARPLSHQYCWEFLAAGGSIKDECKECITYRSRARRCYELKDLPGGMGCLNLLCDVECSACDYYKAVQGQGINVLVISKKQNIVSDLGDNHGADGLAIRFARTEYEAAVAIQQFRPDYVVVDCAFGKKRTAAVCDNLFSDIRIPVARIILSSRTGDVQDYCEKEAFGWIRKPFSVDQLKGCIRGVPKMANGNHE